MNPSHPPPLPPRIPRSGGVRGGGSSPAIIVRAALPVFFSMIESLNYWKIEDSKTPRFKDSKIQWTKDSKNQRIKNWKFQFFKKSKIETVGCSNNSIIGVSKIQLLTLSKTCFSKERGIFNHSIIESLKPARLWIFEFLKFQQFNNSIIQKCPYYISFKNQRISNQFLE